MFSKSLAVGALAAGCVAAAAGGAYVAVRQNASATQQPVPVAVAAAQPPAADTARPVAETEAVVTPAAPAQRPVEPAGAPKAQTVQEPAPQARRRSTTATVPENSARTARREAARPQSRPDTPVASNRPAAEPARPDAPAPPPREGREPAAEPSAPAPVAAPARVDGDANSSPEPSTPPAPRFEELVVPASAVIGLQVETPLSSERARIEDRVDAKVTRDVLADGRVAIPAGARAVGTVMLVERGGKLKERARLGVRFHTLVLADGTEVPINTEAIYREGESPSGDSARKIGGAAVGGAILGALIGGKKGAVVGGATGAAGGTAVVMAGDRNAATLAPGTVVTIRLAAPVAIEVEKR